MWYLQLAIGIPWSWTKSSICDLFQKYVIKMKVIAEQYMSINRIPDILLVTIMLDSYGNLNMYT